MCVSRSRLSEDEDVWTPSVLWPPRPAGPNHPITAHWRLRGPAHFRGITSFNTKIILSHFSVFLQPQTLFFWEWLRHNYVFIKDEFVPLKIRHGNKQSTHFKPIYVFVMTSVTLDVWMMQLHPQTVTILPLQASLLSATCATFIRTLEECMTLANQSLTPDLRPPERVITPCKVNLNKHHS